VPAGKYDMIIDQGSDFAIQLIVKEDGTPRDLTGYSARAHLRARRTDATLSAEFTCSIPEPENGIILMSLSNSVSSALAAKVYYYDLELYITDDVIVTRLLEGKVTLTPETTKDDNS